MFLITTKLKLKQISPVPPAKDDVVNLSTEQDIDGDKTFHHTIKINADSGYNTGLALINISKERNQRMISGYTGDMTSIIGSVYWNKNFTNNNNRVGFRATRHDGGSYADLYVSINPDGTPITYAPTPATDDNSTKIATTAFVNNRLPYTTGTWTPILKGRTTAGTFTYESHVGRYLKIGRFVYILGFINISDYGTYPVGGVIIDGIPFVATNSIYSFGITVRGYSGGVDSSVLKLNTGYINKNSTIITCMSQNKTYPQNVQNASWSSSTTDGYEIMLDSTHKTINIYLSGCYMTD